MIGVGGKLATKSHGRMFLGCRWGEAGVDGLAGTEE